jgi:hypothetical protein
VTGEFLVFQQWSQTRSGDSGENLARRRPRMLRIGIKGRVQGVEIQGVRNPRDWFRS